MQDFFLTIIHKKITKKTPIILIFYLKCLFLSIFKIATLKKILIMKGTFSENFSLKNEGEDNFLVNLNFKKKNG